MSQNFDFTFQMILPLARYHASQKNPDVFELFEKCNKYKHFQRVVNDEYQSPNGYHREMQLFKGPIMQAIDDIKSCLSILTSSIKEVQVKSILQTINTLIFSVLMPCMNSFKGFLFEMLMQIGDAINKGNLYHPKWQNTHIVGVLAT